MDGQFLLDLAAQNGMEPAYKDEEMELMRRKLWELLSKVTQSYTGAGSSSLRAETAQALLRSVSFLIILGLEEDGDSKEINRRLIEENYETLFETGLDAVTACIEAGKTLLKKAGETALNVENTAYSGTTDELSGFFAQYNYYYFAHDIPCMLDYPLAWPVDEKLLGIVYINEYLRRLVLENEFCGLFDKQALKMLIQRLCPDDSLISIYEAVVIQAVGLELIENDIQLLEMTERELQALQKILHDEAARNKWQSAAQTLAERLELPDKAKNYFLETAEEAFWHIRHAAEMGQLEALMPPHKTIRESREVKTLFIDGQMMENERLRALMDEISSCRYVSDKIAMVKSNVKSIRDLFEILNLCFWGDECTAFFEALDETERAILISQLQLRKKRNPDWKSESGWEEYLISRKESQEKAESDS